MCIRDSPQCNPYIRKTVNHVTFWNKLQSLNRSFYLRVLQKYIQMFKLLKKVVAIDVTFSWFIFILKNFLKIQTFLFQDFGFWKSLHVVQKTPMLVKCLTLFKVLFDGCQSLIYKRVKDNCLKQLLWNCWGFVSGLIIKLPYFRFLMLLLVNSFNFQVFNVSSLQFFMSLAVATAPEMCIRDSK